MADRQTVWTEGKVWLYRGHEAIVTRDGKGVDIRQHGGPPLHRFPLTVTYKDLADFIDRQSKAGATPPDTTPRMK